MIARKQVYSLVEALLEVWIVDVLHSISPKNRINDPNGFVYFNGQYHMFYQYFPYEPVWGTMHSGKWYDLADEATALLFGKDYPLGNGGIKALLEP